MPFSFEGLFRCSCIPFLRLEVVGATEVVVPGGANYWVADYTPGVANNITVEAYTVLGTHIDWTATSLDPGANPQHDVTPHHTDRCRIPLNDPRNIVSAGQVITVEATALGLDASVNIVVKPLVTALTVVPDHYAFQDAAGWYALDLSGIPNVNAGALTANLEVVTDPANDAARSHVVWAAIDTSVPGGAIYNLTPIDTWHKGITLNNIGTIQTSVAIPNSPQAMPAAVTVDVRAPAANAALANGLGVELHQFTFAGTGYFGVTQENAGNFNALFPAIWDRANTSRPQAYAARTALDANTTMAANVVTLNVTAQPAGAPTNVTVRATAYYVLANGTLTLLQGATAAAAIAAGTAVNTQVAMGNIAFLPNLPDEIMHNNPLLIFWEISTDAGGTWAPLQVTANTVYVTAKIPVAATYGNLNRVGGSVYSYESLLAASCTAAAGTPAGAVNRDAVRNAVAGAFAPANPNNQIRRLRRQADGTLPPAELITMGYWKPGGGNVAMELNDAVRAVAAGGMFFNNVTGNMQCSVWALALMAIWAQHGIGEGRLVYIVPSVPGKGLAPPAAVLPNTVADTRFLVSNWVYNRHGDTDANNYTHTILPAVAAAAAIPAGAPARAAPVNTGVAGQNNPNPPPQFICHFIVKDGVQDIYFDPSYGAGPLDRDTWVTNSVAGLRNDDNTSPTYLMAGYVNNAPATPPNLGAVSLQDLSTNAWIP